MEFAGGVLGTLIFKQQILLVMVGDDNYFIWIINIADSLQIIKYYILVYKIIIYIKQILKRKFKWY